MAQPQRSRSSAPSKSRASAGHGAALARLLADAERLMTEGRALLAKPFLDEALAKAPGHAGVHRLLAVRALLLKSNEEAIEHAQAACALDASNGDLRMVLGRAYKAAGRMDDALEAYRAAVNLDPRLAEAHVSLGIALKLRGQLSEAIACYRQALVINPQLAAAHANLGNALLLQADQLGLSAESTESPIDPAADEAQRLAVELDPKNAQARANWARSLDRSGNSHKAIDLLNSALGLDPTNEDICMALVGVLFKLRSFEAAHQVLMRWVPANPGRRPTTVNCVATALLHLDRYSDALEWARKAEALAPEEPDVLYNIGAVLIHRLQVAEALDIFRRIVGLSPGYTMARESLVLCLNYVETDPQRVVDEHQAFGRAITRHAPADAPALPPLLPKPRLRVAVLSGDLRRHSVGYFIEPVFEHHDRDRIELVAYHSSRHFDEVSQRLKDCTHRWVSCESMTDDQLVKRIRSDGIDILIDLAGTTADGRPEVFAQRAAPVQIVYLGYPTTTGIPNMDFRISDAVIDPSGHEPYSTEGLLRFRHSMFCYRPDSNADVGDPPHARNGYVTFGSFNNLPKYSDLALSLWAQVLQAVPRSKLLIKSKALGDLEVQKLLGERFAKLGIGRDRLLFNPWRPDLRSHLEVYQDVDIALDTFPYNGATTTCESLWAGVPVVSLQGRTHTSRMGASILTAIGCTEWIANDAEAFIDIARGLAADSQALAAFRRSARQRLSESALMQGRAHTQDLERLLFEAWEKRCEAQALGADAEAAGQAVHDGHGHAARGAHDAALRDYQRATSIAPRDLHALWGVARTLANLMRVDEAIEALERLLDVDATAAPAWSLMGGMLEYQGRVDAARAAYDRSLALVPNDATRICRDLLLPSILPFGVDIEALRAEHERALRDLLRRPLRLIDPLQEVHAGPVNEYFRLAYHGRGNRSLHELYGALMLKACPELAWTAPHCRAGRSSRRAGPIRVGFISLFFRQHSIGKTSVGLIEQLARPEFHVTALFIPPRRDDALSRRIADAADEVVDLPGDLAASRQAIAELELDILFYQDIGMEPHSYYLAFARLAPVQCVSFGHPDTTGIPTMDAWISTQAFEPPDAQAHYSERLITIPDAGTLACYDRPVLLPTEAIGRAGFELPPDVPLLACPQGLFKFHPEMDELLAAILKRLPEARLLLVQGDVPAYRDQLVARWRARGDGIDRAAVFFPPLQHQSFLALFSIADAVLDTVHFNGMNSSLEALAMGAPVVTLPKAFQRARHTQGMYRRMGYTELVARDEAHYVDLVVRLAEDVAFRQAAREQILSRCGVLFREEAVVRGFEAAFRTLVETAVAPEPAFAVEPR